MFTGAAGPLQTNDHPILKLFVMPLPVNTTLSLQGQARPGEGITTKPKRAMIVRLTEETLDALQKLSGSEAMEFEFGSSMVSWYSHL